MRSDESFFLDEVHSMEDDGFEGENLKDKRGRCIKCGAMIGVQVGLGRDAETGSVCEECNE